MKSLGPQTPIDNIAALAPGTQIERCEYCRALGLATELCSIVSNSVNAAKADCWGMVRWYREQALHDPEVFDILIRLLPELPPSIVDGLQESLAITNEALKRAGASA